MGESVPVWSNQKKRDEARTRQKDQQKQKKRANFSTSWIDFKLCPSCFFFCWIGNGIN